MPPLFLSPVQTRHAPLLADRLGLTFDVGEEGRVVIPLQPLLDEGPEDDLKAHRELERDRRLPPNDPSSVQGVSGENEEDSGPGLEHRHLRILPPGPPAPDRTREPHLFLYILYHLYNIWCSPVKRS